MPLLVPGRRFRYTLCFMRIHRHRRKKEWYRKRRPHAKRRILPALGGGGRLYYLLIAVGALLLAAYLAYGRLTEDSDEKRLRQLVYTAQRAVEAKDVATCMSLLDETYTDNQRNDYKTIQRHALRELDHVRDVRLGIRNVSVQVEPGATRANMEFEIRFRAQVDDGSGRSFPVIGVLNNRVPIGAVWERVRLVCVKRGDDWRISHAAIESLK